MADITSLNEKYCLINKTFFVIKNYNDINYSEIGGFFIDGSQMLI